MNEQPKVILYSKSGPSYDITSLCDGIQWSGDYQQAARKVDLDILHPVHDKNQDSMIPVIGDYIMLYADDKEVFRGIVWSRDLTSDNQFLKITAYDALIHLTKSSGSYNFKNITPAAATRKICLDCGLPVGELTSPNVTYSDCALGKNLYEIIMAGYSKASAVNGKKYYPRMKGGKLYTFQKGAYTLPEPLDDNYNLSKAQHTETLDAMINKVIVYDEKGKVITTKVNQEWLNAYGIIQAALSSEEGKDNSSLATAALKPMDRKCSIDAFGYPEAIAGNAVKLLAPHSDLTGLFYIDGDTHSWKNGIYTMNLVLNFENLMDSKEITEESNG